MQAGPGLLQEFQGRASAWLLKCVCVRVWVWEGGGGGARLQGKGSEQTGQKNGERNEQSSRKLSCRCAAQQACLLKRFVHTCTPMEVSCQMIRTQAGCHEMQLRTGAKSQTRPQEDVDGIRILRLHACRDDPCALINLHGLIALLQA